MKIFLHLRFSLLSETWQGDIGAYMRGGWLLFMILTLMPYQYLYWDLGGKKDKGRVTNNRYCQHNLLGGKLTIYSPFQIWPLEGYNVLTYVWYGYIALWALWRVSVGRDGMDGSYPLHALLRLPACLWCWKWVVIPFSFYFWWTWVIFPAGGLHVRNMRLLPSSGGDPTPAQIMPMVFVLFVPSFRFSSFVKALFPKFDIP